MTRVLVLAGQREGVVDPLCETAGIARKALLPVLGVAQLDRVRDALSGAGLPKPYWLSGLGEAREGFVEVPSGVGPADSVAMALEGTTEWPVLVTTADHPLLTAEMVRHFVDAAERSGADLCVGLASREVIQASSPDTTRTYLKFSNVQVSGCNLFYLKGPEALAAIRFWQRAQRDRKKPLKLASHFGPGLLAQYALGKLSLTSAFGQASRKLGIVARPVMMPFAEAAIDLDKPSDLPIVERILKARAAA